LRSSIVLKRNIRTVEGAISFGRFRRYQGRCAEAHDLLAPVYGWFSESFDSDLKDAKALLHEVAASPGPTPGDGMRARLAANPERRRRPRLAPAAAA
jgi:hypothetical protein